MATLEWSKSKLVTSSEGGSHSRNRSVTQSATFGHILSNSDIRSSATVSIERQPVHLHNWFDSRHASKMETKRRNLHSVRLEWLSWSTITTTCRILWKLDGIFSILFFLLLLLFRLSFRFRLKTTSSYWWIPIIDCYLVWAVIAKVHSMRW